MGFFNRRLDISGGMRAREWSFPPKTLLGWIVAVIIGAFVAQYFTTGEEFEDSWVTTGGWLSLDLLKAGEVWRLVTHAFLHASLIHILGNLLMIWFTGQELNPFLGNRKFAILFFGSGILGGLVQLFVHDLPLVAAGGESSVLIGASGAAFGLLVAYCMLAPERELFLLLYFIIPIRMRAKNLARGAVIVSLVLGVIHFLIDLGWIPDFYFPLRSVAHWAHLGGALGGYLFVKWRKIKGDALDLDFYELQRERRELNREIRDWRGDHSPEALMEAKMLSQEIEAKVNPILDKLNMEGIESLSPKERQILEEAQRELDRRAGGGL